jgi:hypothetical protein
VWEEDGLRLSTAEKEAKPVSHTVMLLNAGASTHRWARATLRGLAAVLARCGAREREEKQAE